MLVEAAICVGVLALLFLALSAIIEVGPSYITQSQVNHELAITAALVEQYANDPSRSPNGITNTEDSVLEPYYDWCTRKCTAYTKNTTTGVISCSAVAPEPASKPLITCPDAIVLYRMKRIVDTVKIKSLKNDLVISSDLTSGSPPKVKIGLTSKANLVALGGAPTSSIKTTATTACN